MLPVNKLLLIVQLFELLVILEVFLLVFILSKHALTLVTVVIVRVRVGVRLLVLGTVGCVGFSSRLGLAGLATTCIASTAALTLFGLSALVVSRARSIGAG